MSSAITASTPYRALGRVKQKRRTHAALVTAAQELIEQGRVPSVAEAAERAGVARATAYRYFPVQDQLLVEASLQALTPSVQQMLDESTPADDPEKRLAAVVTGMHTRVVNHEAAFRTYLRLSLEQSVGDGSYSEFSSEQLRLGRRLQWLDEALATVRGRVGELRWRRLVMALSPLLGIEALVVLQDVCRLSPDEALGVTQWAARTLLRASLDEAGADSRLS